MGQFPHYKWQLHDLGMLLCYSVKKKKSLEFNWEKSLRIALPTSHPLIIFSHLSPSCRHMNTPSPLLGQHDIWTKVDTEICYLNIVVCCMPCPLFIRLLHVSKCSPGYQLPPRHFYENFLGTLQNFLDHECKGTFQIFPHLSLMTFYCHRR